MRVVTTLAIATIALLVACEDKNEQRFAAPVLVSPANDAVVGDTALTFDWSDVTNAEEYQIVVARDSGFYQPVRDATPDVSQYVVTSPLGVGTYWWRVRVEDSRSGNIEYGDWSAVWQLTVVADTVL